MQGEPRIDTRACPTMDWCDTSVLTPCRKSSKEHQYQAEQQGQHRRHGHPPGGKSS